MKGWPNRNIFDAFYLENVKVQFVIVGNLNVKVYFLLAKAKVSFAN